jgi:hypothetical protein
LEAAALEGPDLGTLFFGFTCGSSSDSLSEILGFRFLINVSFLVPEESDFSAFLYLGLGSLHFE